VRDDNRAKKKIKHTNGFIGNGFVMRRAHHTKLFYSTGDFHFNCLATARSVVEYGREFTYKPINH
jgi:hypothetical protein